MAGIGTVMLVVISYRSTICLLCNRVLDRPPLSVLVR
jgi:hypothetical protein